LQRESGQSTSDAIGSVGGGLVGLATNFLAWETKKRNLLLKR